MRTGLIVKKLGMSSMFTEDGKRLTLTLLKLDNCQVVGRKVHDRDGYDALIVGAVLQKISKVSKSMRVVFANAQLEPRAVLKEFVIDKESVLDIGTVLKPSHYKIGQYVDVSGKTIGKGFAGVMKRHNFGGLEASHGVSVSHRSHGSTGQCQDPGKVFKGKKMAGHMGDTQVTIQNLRIVQVDDSNGIIIVSGSVPGAKGSYLVIKDAIKKIV